MSDLYRDFIDQKADQIINSLGGTITPAPGNAEMYRDFLDRKFDDVINAVDNVKIKTFTYTGNGNAVNNTITFPTKPLFVLAIIGYYDNETTSQLMPIPYGSEYAVIHPIQHTPVDPVWKDNTSRTINTIWNDNELTLNYPSGQYASRTLNINNKEYTVYYI